MDADDAPLTPKHGRLGEVLKRLRKKAKVTQASLAAALGRPQPFVSKYEKGRLRVDAVELIDISRVIGCSLDEVAEEVLAQPQRPGLAASLRRRPDLPGVKRATAGKKKPSQPPTSGGNPSGRVRPGRK